jgi:ferric-dicitrate binding protein FerR (iron transport regulator)
MRKVARNATLVVLCLASLLAHTASRSAVAIVLGDVALNGNSVTRSTPVFDGDRLTTGTNAGVLLHLKGATVQLSSNSDVRYRGERLELASGTAQVRGMEAIVSGPFTIEAAGNAYFRIERAGAQSKLAVLEGKVKVTRGKNCVTVADRDVHLLADDDPIAAVGRSSLPKEMAAGASGGAAGAAITNWMNRGKNQMSVSRKSPAEP